MLRTVSLRYISIIVLVISLYIKIDCQNFDFNFSNLEKYNFLVEYKNYEFAIIKQLEFLKKIIEINNSEENNISEKYNNKNNDEYYDIILKIPF